MTRHRNAERRFSAWILACLTLVLAASGCGKSQPPDTRAADEKALRDVDAQWSAAAATKNVDAAVSYYSDNAILLPPNSPAATDKQTIRGIWSELLAPDTSLSWQATRVEASRSGDLGYVAGTYQMALKDPQGKPTTDRGKFLEVWKKQADGKWKCVADTYSSDLPLPAPPPAQKKTKAHHHSSHKKGHAKQLTSGD